MVKGSGMGGWGECMLLPPRGNKSGIKVARNCHLHSVLYLFFHPDPSSSSFVVRPTHVWKIQLNPREGGRGWIGICTYIEEAGVGKEGKGRGGVEGPETVHNPIPLIAPFPPPSQSPTALSISKWVRGEVMPKLSKKLEKKKK